MAPDALLPPVSLRRTYYRSTAREAYRRACEAAMHELMSRGLRPDHRVLDIGCGIGNLAVPLTEYLRGNYHGFDVNADAIDWCRRAISSRWPHFHFHHVDVESVAYHDRGTHSPDTFVFPLESASVDMAFAGSVFTHLLPAAAEQYIRECGRVLADGGTCITSFFLLNDESRTGVEAGHSFMRFAYGDASKQFALHDVDVPEAAVALDEAMVRRWFDEAGLTVTDVRRGRWWSGRSDDQDVITAVRRCSRT